MAEDKDTFKVERSTTIEAPAAKVWELLVDFHEWARWSPWEKLDPDMQRTFSGPESGLGATYAWEGNRKAGAGKMEVIETNEPTKLVFDLHFLKPFKAHNVGGFDLVEDAGSTTVTWSMTGTKNLFTKIMGIFKSMDAMIGPDFEEGLANMKAAAEA